MGTVVALAAVLALTGAAQAAWAPAGALAGGRYNHTATLLNDGRVLVAGGNDGDPVATARLYDPATNGWSNAATMNFARHGHAAALLKSGKVLVAGGFAPTADPVSPLSGYTRTAEIYDPDANTWTQAASMGTGRFAPTMTVLGDGRVLVAGGTGDVDTPDGPVGAVSLDSAEIYDPATDAWSDASTMSAPRALATATLLPSGSVLVAGGFDDASGGLKSADIYDPATNVWSPTDQLAEARDAATATALPDGDVLVAGGDGGAGSALASAEIYDETAGTWRGAAPMAAARQSAAAALLADGTVLVTGGETARFGDLLATTERYDPAQNTWTDGGAMAAARRQHTVTALADGRALVVGGNAGGFSGGLTGVERFSAATAALTGASFGSLLVGTPSDVATSLYTNTGGTPVTVTGVSVAGGAGDFAVVSNTCLAAPVAPAATCEIGVRFTPSAAGARSATLTVADASTAAGTTTAALTGTGTTPAPAGGGTGATGGPTGAGATAGAGPAAPGGAVAGATAGSGTLQAAVARATCRVKTTRRNGRARSTVTCRVTMPSSATAALRGRLMRGAQVLSRTRTTARGGHAALRLRPSGTLRRGRYAVVIARPDGTVVARGAIRVR